MSPATDGEVGGEVVSAAVVDETIDALCALRREHAIMYSIEVGRVVVERVYGGDLDRLRERRDKGCLSLRALAAHPRMPLSASALHQAVGVYTLVTRVPGLLDTELSLTHLRAVLPLAEDEQDELLSRAVAGGWTTKRLAQAVRARRPARGHTGRPRLPRVVKTLHRLDRLAEEDEAWGDLDEIGELPSEKRRVIAENVALLERRLRGVKLRLSASGDGVSSADGQIVWRRPADRLAVYGDRGADE